MEMVEHKKTTLKGVVFCVYPRPGDIYYEGISHIEAVHFKYWNIKGELIFRNTNLFNSKK